MKILYFVVFVVLISVIFHKDIIELEISIGPVTLTGGLALAFILFIFCPIIIGFFHFKR